MGFIGAIGKVFPDPKTIIRVPEQIAEEAARAAREAERAAERAFRKTAEALEEAGFDPSAFFHPLKTVSLPDGYGTLYVYPGVYRVHLTSHAIDRVGKGAGAAVAIAGLAGAIIGASGGTLAPVAGILAAYLAAEWAVIEAVKTSKGVYLYGAWAPPRSEIVPTPA